MFASRKTISSIAFVHAVLFLFPDVAIALQQPSISDIGTGIFAGFSAIVNTRISLVFVALQFYPLEGRQFGSEIRLDH